jgi:hypothetical protein
MLQSSHRPLPLAFFVAFVIFRASAGLAQLPDEPAIRAAVERRLAALQSVIVEYGVEHSFFPKRIVDAEVPGPGGGRVTTKTGTERSTVRFSFLAGRARWDTTISPETADAEAARNIVPVIETIEVFVAPEVQHLTVRRGRRPLGSIRPQRSPRGLRTVDAALGLRDGFQGGADPDARDGGWITPETLRKMSVARDPQGRVVMEYKNGVNQTLRWTFDPKLGHALVSFQRLDAEFQKVIEEVAASDFANFDGLMLPRRVVLRDTHTDGHVAHEWVGTVKSYRLNDPANAPDHYPIAWRKGMIVADGVRMAHVQITEDGQKLPSP